MPPMPTRPLERLTLLTVCCAGLWLGACAAPAATANGQRLQDWHYVCADGATLEVSYLNASSGESFASFLYQGQMAVLENRPSGSGARYVDQDEQRGLRWHTQGNGGLLSLQPPDHTAAERTLLSDCRGTPAR